MTYIDFYGTMMVMAEGLGKSAEDVSGVCILRPELKHEEIELRGRSLSVSGRKNILKSLRTLHTLEIMAVNIYRYQLTRDGNELNRELIAAMCNEMTHVQDFQVKLCEYGMRSNLFRWAYWIVGFVFGFGSRLLGTKAILKTGIWVESKAVAHYAELLNAAPWDETTRHIILKDQSDEDRHIRTWQRLLNVFEDKGSAK